VSQGSRELAVARDYIDEPCHLEVHSCQLHPLQVTRDDFQMICDPSAEVRAHYPEFSPLVLGRENSVVDPFERGGKARRNRLDRSTLGTRCWGFEHAYRVPDLVRGGERMALAGRVSRA
jgi:hypothetical protein